MIRKIFQRVAKGTRHYLKKVSTSVRSFRGKSDYGRWASEGELSPDWDTRTEKIAYLVEPGNSVLEFGAGRMVLKKFLSTTCEYTPSDLVDRGSGTIVCDLNGPELPQFPPHDTAVFSGVLEYINDVPRLILHLSKHVEEIIASYSVTELNRNNRRVNGWVNDYSSDQFLLIFKNAGFNLKARETWRQQVIFKFTKNIVVRNQSTTTPIF